MAKPLRLLIVEEVAAILRINPKTVQRAASAGKIPAIKTPGGGWRFYESDIIAIQKSLEDPATTYPNWLNVTSHPS